MPFFLENSPTFAAISEAINYLLGNSQQTTSTNIVNGQVTDASGTIVSYLYKYIYVKYADSFDGTVNFSNTPTGRLYYGLRNNDSATESTNPADYIWYQVVGGFSTNKFVFYSVTGGRRINIVVGLSAPSILYQADTGVAIDLDQISGSDGASSRICYAKSTSTSLASTPTTYQTSGPNGFPPTNTWGGGETWQATPPTLSVNEALFQSDGIYNPTTDLTTWNVPYLSNLRVGALSAITANLGSITAGSLNAVTITGSDLTIGSSPAISGTTMTGSGTQIYNDGRFALGNSTANITFNGTSAVLNGFTSGPQTASSGVNVFSGSATIGTLTLNRSGLTLFTFNGEIRVVDTNPTSVPAMRYVANGSLNVQILNSASTVLYTMQFNFGGASVLQSYISGAFGRPGVSDFYQLLGGVYPIILPADTYTIKASAGGTRRDSAGADIGPASGAYAASLLSNLSLFQVAA